METFINIEEQKRLDKANKLLNNQPKSKEESKKLFQQTLSSMYHAEKTHESYILDYSKKMSEKDNTYHKIYHLLLNKEYELAKTYYDNLENNYKNEEFTKSINKIYKSYKNLLDKFKKDCKSIIIDNNLSKSPLTILDSKDSFKDFLNLAKQAYPDNIYQEISQKATNLKNILK